MGTDEFDVEEAIKKNYDLQVQKIEKIKNVYKIDDQKQRYCLKVIKYKLPHFLFIIGAMKYLQDRGFENIPAFIKTLSGQDYIEIVSSKISTETIGFAYLTDWIDAREGDYDNPLDILIATIKLAELHSKSKGFIVTDNMKPRIGWLKWGENFQNRINEIESFKKIIAQKENKTEFDSLYSNALEEEYNRAQRSIKNLNASDYIIKMKQEKSENGFCHHDYAHHNVLISNLGKVNIIDFDYCILDTHLHDLSSLLIRRMKCGNWDIENAVFILETYNSIMKINENDIPIISAFMQFPQDFWQLGIQYYYEKLAWEEDNFMRRLTRYLEDRQQKQEFLEDFSIFKYSY